MASLQETNSSKRPGQRRGDEPTASTKNSGAKKSEQKEFKPANAPYTHKKEPPPEGMPLITMQSGVFIDDIKAGIISYCQRMDLSRTVFSKNSVFFSVDFPPIYPWKIPWTNPRKGEIFRSLRNGIFVPSMDYSFD